jgi:hypothetical protein
VSLGRHAEHALGRLPDTVAADPVSPGVSALRGTSRPAEQVAAHQRRDGAQCQGQHHRREQVEANELEGVHRASVAEVDALVVSR